MKKRFPTLWPYAGKTKARWLKPAARVVFTLLLLWMLYVQLSGQYERAGAVFQWHTGALGYVAWAVLLLPLSFLAESIKWQMLVKTAMPLSLLQSLRSVLGGVALSMITPNRLGEYPGRILFLKQKGGTRLASISVLGATAQLLAVLLFGVVGLVWYGMAHPLLWVLLLLAVTSLVAGAVLLFYARFELWAPRLERFSWLVKIQQYAAALRETTGKERLNVLLISLLRYAVFSFQLLLLLRWQAVEVPWAEGYFLCLLFFYALAVVPTIALAELGVRGAIGIYLFAPWCGAACGVLLATLSLWMLNLALPALAGAVLLWQQRYRSLTGRQPAAEIPE